MSRPRGAPAALAIALCLGCAHARPAALADVDRAAIRQTIDSTLAIINAPPPKDFAGYARSYYMPDAVSMPPNMPAVTGRAAIAALESTDSSAYQYRWVPLEIEGYRDLAWLRGRYWSWGGGSQPDSGKYLEIWRRQSGGGWRVARDMYSSDVPRRAAAAPAEAGAAGARAALVGTWRLERYVDTPDGQAPIFAFGTAPIGLFVFTADGHVSISFMRNPPAVGAASADPDPDACTPAWYCSYFGTYDVDASGGRWVTHVLGGNIPSYLGTDQARSFVIRGDRLVIAEVYAAGGRTVHAERVLVKVRESK